MSISPLKEKKLNHAAVNLPSLFRKFDVGTELKAHQDAIVALNDTVGTLPENSDDIITMVGDLQTAVGTLPAGSYDIATEVGTIKTSLSGLTNHIEVLTGNIDSYFLDEGIKTYTVIGVANMVGVAFCFVYGHGSSPVTSTSVNTGTHEINLTFEVDVNTLYGCYYIILALKDLL